MRLALPFPEAVALATSGKPLPAILRSLECRGETLHAQVDLEALPSTSFAIRIAAAAAGTVTVTARLLRYTDGVATFAVTAHARGLPAHKLLPFLLEPINNAIRDRGLPEGLIEIQRGEEDPLVLIGVQQAVETKVSGITVTDLQLADAVIHAEAVIGTVTLH